MGMPDRGPLAVVLLFVFMGACTDLEAASAPYTIVTADGQRVAVLDPPRNTGKVTKFRTHPDGRLSSLPSARIDWKSTDTANTSQPAAPSVTSKPAPATSTARLSALAGTLSVDESRANAAGDTMKLKSGKAADMNDSGPFFGEKSVMDYLAVGNLVFSAAGCPAARAAFAGSVTNKSKKKIRDLRGLVLLAERGSNRTTERMESFDPPNLAPGEEAEIFLYLSCDSANSRSFVAVLRDVSGTVEDVAKPGRENPFVQPAAPVRK